MAQGWTFGDGSCGLGYYKNAATQREPDFLRILLNHAGVEFSDSEGNFTSASAAKLDGSVVSAHLLAGRKLIRRDGSLAPADALEGKVTLLYFSASWCPPCHRFTPVLAEFYSDVAESGGNIEVVYVPGDRSKADMMKYFQDLHGNWLALELGSEAVFIRSLSEKFSVSGIPAVVVIQSDGTVIDANARGQIQSRGPAAFAAWRAAWRSPAFSGQAHALGGGGGPGVSRLLGGDSSHLS